MNFISNVTNFKPDFIYQIRNQHFNKIVLMKSITTFFVTLEDIDNVKEEIIILTKHVSGVKETSKTFKNFWTVFYEIGPSDQYPEYFL